MKNQTASLEKSIQDNQDKRKQSFDQLRNSNKTQGQLNKSSTQGGRNLIAVVDLDLGDNQKDVIRVFQDDDIHQVVLNFCNKHELEERCIGHMFEIITQQINSAKTKEMLNRIQSEQKEFSLQDQLHYVHSSEKEDIQSQTTNTSSKQNLFQLSTFSPGQAYGLKDPFQSIQSSQSFKREKLTFIKNGKEQHKRGDFQEGEPDFEYDSDYNSQESLKQCKGFQQRSFNRTLTQQMENNQQKKRIEISRKQNERSQSRNTSKSHHEDESSLLKNSFVEQLNQLENSKKQSFVINEDLKQPVLENFEKQNKLIGTKKLKSIEDSKFTENGNNLSNTNLHDEKRSRSQSQITTPCQQFTKQNTSINDKKSIDKKMVENKFAQNDNQNSDDDCNLDEYQILEISKNEGLIPNNLTKSQQKIIINKAKEKARISPKRNTPFLTSSSSRQPSSQSSSNETKLNKILHKTSNIEQAQNLSINNTSRLDHSKLNSSFISSLATTQQNFGSCLIQSIPDQNSNKREDIAKINNIAQKTPTRNSKNHEKQFSPLQARNSSKLTNSQNQQKIQGQLSLQKRVQGIIPLLDMKKVQNNSEFHTKQYAQTSRSPSTSYHQANSTNKEEVQLRGNQTERDHSQKQNISIKNIASEQISVINQISNQNLLQIKQKPLISERKKQQSEHHQQQNFNLSSKNNKIQNQKDQNLNNSNIRHKDSFLYMNQDSTSLIQSQNNTFSQPENPSKVNIESYKKQLKIQANAPLTDRSIKRDEYFEGRLSQSRGQQDKRLQLSSIQTKGFKKQHSPLHSQSINLGLEIKSPLRSNVSEILEHDKNNVHQQITAQENNLQEQQNILFKPSSPPTTISNVMQTKDQKKTNNKGVFVIPGTKQINEQKDFINKNQQAEQINSNDLQVNRLSRQKEAPKLHDNMSNSNQQPSQQKEILKKTESNLNSQQQPKINNYISQSQNQDEFTKFLQQQIFDKMDSDGDGYISVMDVDINSLNTDILAILQNFLIQMADNNSLQYSFSEFFDFIHSNKQIYEEFKQIYIKKYNLSNNFKQKPVVQQLQKQQQIQLQELSNQQLINQPTLPKQQQIVLNNQLIGQQQQQVQQKQQYQQKQQLQKQHPQIIQQLQQQVLQKQQPQLFLQQQQSQLLLQQQQQQLIEQQQKQIIQLQQQLEQSQKQQINSNLNQSGQQQSQPQFIQQQQQAQLDQKQQQHQIIKDQLEQNNAFNEVVKQYPIINQFSAQQQNQLQKVIQNNQLIKQQNYQQYQPKQQHSIQQKEQQQPFVKHIQENSQSNQQILQNKFSLQPQYIIPDDEDVQGEEAPIKHFVDLSKHINNKKYEISSQQQLINHLKSSSKKDNTISFGNFSSSASIQQNDIVNFSFSEEVINRQQKLSSSKSNYPPILNNIQIKDFNTPSQNHSPSFHEQGHIQNPFGIQSNIQECNQNESDQIGQELLISFSNQVFDNRESFGSNNNSCQQSSSQKGDPIDINQFEIISSSPPQILPNRYKNLVTKQFNPSSSNQN